MDPLGPDFAYMQVADSIAVRIEAGEITHKLPAERDLAQEYGVAYQTVRRVLKTIFPAEVVQTLHAWRESHLEQPIHVPTCCKAAHRRRPTTI